MKVFFKRTPVLTGMFLMAFCAINAQSFKPMSWDKITVKNKTKSAAFVTIEDLDKDGKDEILMSSLIEEGSPAFMSSTKGALRVFTNLGNTLEGPWKEYSLISTRAGLPFINKPFIFDVNGDNIKDIVVCTGFIKTGGGSLQWMPGPYFNKLIPFTESTKKNKSGYFWHECVQLDLDRDGYLDIVTTSAKEVSNKYVVRVEWFRHHGNGNYTHHVINETLGGVFIKNFDVDRDGDQDLVLSNFFTAPQDASLVWLELVSRPSESNNWAGAWKRHNIDNTTGKGYNIEFFDIDADGKLELVYNNHNNLDNKMIVDPSGNRIPSGVYWFEFPYNPRSVSAWQKHVIGEGWKVDAFDFGNPASQGSPGIISVGDLDRNGLPDVVVPGDGTDHLWILWQNKRGNFIREKIDDGQMYGSSVVCDLDKNGTLEVVATMHEYTDGMIQAIFNPVPFGHIKIYSPYAAASRQEMKSTEEISEPIAGEQVPVGKLKVWPNPASNQLFMETTGEVSIENIRILNISGQEFEVSIMNDKNENSFRANIDALPAGMYVVTVGNTGSYTKFIKY